MAKFDDLETHSVRQHEVAALTELDDSEVKRALRSLAAAEPPFIRSAGAAGLTYPLIISGVTERARRAVGQWPASDLAADAILSALSSAADQEQDEEKRSGLRRVVSFLGGAGKEVLYRVVTQVSGQEITQHLPHL